mgnify:FL=1
MKRVTVADIMEQTGLSRATVDRVLNGRGRVHARTKHVVHETIQRLQSPAGTDRFAPSADMLLRVGRGMTRQMTAVWEARGVKGDIHDVYDATEADIIRSIRRLAEDPSRPLILTVKNSDGIVEALRQARSTGKRIITLVSDVAPDARDHFVGIDNRAAGQTAAYLIGGMLAGRQATVGVVVGDTAFRCHEDREIGFRTGLRAQFPRLTLAPEARGEDSADLARRAVARLLAEHPQLAAIYNVGGGNQGLAAALEAAGRAGDVAVVSHDVNFVTAPLLREHMLNYVIASDPAHLLTTALGIATAPPETRDTTLVDFGIYSRFNVPAFAQ